MVTLDFETDAIVGNPTIAPPRPVGCAIYDTEYAYPLCYMAWGHPSGNNCEVSAFRRELDRIIASGEPLCFHNAPFDLSVLSRYFAPTGFNWLRDWRRVHDTMYLLFLADPYADTYSLKPSADRYLELVASEQQSLHEYILAHFPEATAKTAGAFIARCPGDVVAPYARGDVVRTARLFSLLHPRIVQEGMEPAYDRERRLAPILVDATRRGVRLDRELLARDETRYSDSLSRSEHLLCARLDCPRDVLDHDESLADALDRMGAVREWVLTPKSRKRSMSQANLKIDDPQIRVLMEYRGAMQTCLQTFMRPWLQLSEADGRLHPNWNSTRQDRDGFKTKGARTGRLSSDSPNFQNVPTEWVYADGKPMLCPDGCDPYPVLRRYILPEEGHRWLKRDFSSQEVRILAHYEDGDLLAAYRDNPKLDPHGMAREMIQRIAQMELVRRVVKIVGFSIIYGTGITGLSLQLKVPYEQAAAIMSAYLRAFPGINDLRADIQRIGKLGQQIRTWGGRLYRCEPPRIIDGRMRTFEYKLLNYLIQGSAADQTKQAIIDWYELDAQPLLMATVHDEINISAPIAAEGIAMDKLRLAMDADRLDCPMQSDGETGDSWGSLRKYED